MDKPLRITSGIEHLDQLLDGLFIGDNVVWQDVSGSLASTFCFNFIEASKRENKSIIYVSFDRSPKNLLDKLGKLAHYPLLTILDCFTWGKGAGAPAFLRFYARKDFKPPCSIIMVKEPQGMDQVTEELYAVHSTMKGDVRLVIESITGMQEVWGGEDRILKFYSHSCPRLYELNTVAYWIMEKQAHSSRLRAQITQIAQVVLDLSIKRGTTSLTILKAENRDLDRLHQPHPYWVKDINIVFKEAGGVKGGLDLGLRLKELRTKRGLSQTELARWVGVTPSTISQVESNLIYPSLPALLKIAEVLCIDISSLLQEKPGAGRQAVFQASEAVEVKLAELPDEAGHASLLLPVGLDRKVEPYVIEINPQQEINSHFFMHKGEEMGYLISGILEVTLEQDIHSLYAGDVLYLTSEIPRQWRNPGSETARLLWLKIK